MPPILQFENVTKNFGGLTALVSFSTVVQEREIFSIIGPNGAGKTTLFNIITGLFKADEGRIIYQGKNDLTLLAPHTIFETGVARTFQNIRLFSDLSVIENVMVACYSRKSSGLMGVLFCLPRELKESREIREKAMNLLNKLGLYEKRTFLPQQLSYGEQRKLELARALISNPKVLLLDELTSGMNEKETKQIMDFILRLREEGLTVLLIQHDMKMVMTLSDRIVVLNFGIIISEGTPSFIQKDSKVIEVYLGVSD